MKTTSQSQAPIDPAAIDGLGIGDDKTLVSFFVTWLAGAAWGGVLGFGLGCAVMFWVLRG